MKRLLVESSMWYERSETAEASKAMLLRLTSRTGVFEFEFTPEQWHTLGMAAQWFDNRKREGSEK